MEQTHLFPLIRANVQALLNGYLQATAILQDIDSYIIPAALGGRAGVLGAIALAESTALAASTAHAARTAHGEEAF